MCTQADVPFHMATSDVYCDVQTELMHLREYIGHGGPEGLHGVRERVLITERLGQRRDVLKIMPRHRREHAETAEKKCLNAFE